MQLGHQLCVVVIFFTSRKKKLRTFFAVRTFLSRLAWTCGAAPYVSEMAARIVAAATPMTWQLRLRDLFRTRAVSGT